MSPIVSNGESQVSWHERGMELTGMRRKALNSSTVSWSAITSGLSLLKTRATLLPSDLSAGQAPPRLVFLAVSTVLPFGTLRDGQRTEIILIQSKFGLFLRKTPRQSYTLLLNESQLFKVIGFSCLHFASVQQSGHFHEAVALQLLCEVGPTSGQRVVRVKVHRHVRNPIPAKFKVLLFCSPFISQFRR